jgi:glucosamine-6-phosphate deaminase
MEMIIQPDADTASRIAAGLVAKLVKAKPDAVLGFATGGTPLLLYKELARLHRTEGLDFSRITTFNLDEYVGVRPDHPCSYTRFMMEKLFSHINVRPENIHIPNGMTKNIPEECARYEKAISDAGGIDLQVVGIGTDGHIGFNEPCSSLASRTRIKSLTEQTRKDNARFFSNLNEVPKHCITMGVGTIMESRKIIFLAFGEDKADIVAKAVEGPITAMVPASTLQLHPDVRVFVDVAAAAKLERKNYYQWVYANKPDWQKF